MATTRRFEFGPCLGRGSFGEVYSASMRSPGGLQTSVAVKLLRSDLDLKGDAVLRLRDEGRLLAHLNHPAILKVFDLVTLQGRLALITELVDGADLAVFSGNIPARAVVQAMGQVAGALHAAYHATGPSGPLNLVHRDVKPSNTRLERHGQAKLLDFGIARFDATDREVRTASDMVVGSVPYMAPERFIERIVHPSSDVFSVGCTLYEGITGKRFYGSNQVAKVTGLALHPERFTLVLRERIDSLQVPDSVREFVATMLAYDPDERPPASEVADRLEELADTMGGPTLRMWCRDRDWPPPPSLDGPLEGQVLEEGQLDALTPVPARRTPIIHHAALETLQTELAQADRAVGITLAPPSEEISRAETMDFPPGFSDPALLPAPQRPTIVTSNPSEQETQQRSRPVVSRPPRVPTSVPEEGLGVGGWLVIGVVGAALAVGVISVLVLVPGLVWVLAV